MSNQRPTEQGLPPEETIAQPAVQGLPPPSVRAIKWKQMFVALTYPNYRLWFRGQIVSLFGTWMQTTAQGFLIYDLTHSAAYLGYVGFASGLPAWFLTLYGGVVADRLPRRMLMLVTQSSMMTLAFVLALLTFLHVVQPWHILVLAAGLGVANAFDAPSRQAFVVELVSREDLPNAIALNSAMFQTAMAVGPAVSGVTYALFGPAWCFTINGLTFIAVIVALASMKLKPFIKRVQPKSTLLELKEGIQYAFSHRTIRAILGIIAVTSCFIASLTTIIPAWAVTILGGDATTNGVLLSARGAGSLIGALTIASLGRFKFKGKLLTVGTFAAPTILVIFAMIRWLPLSLVFVLGIGTASMLITNLANTLVQTLVPDALRGRIMGVYSLTFFGFMPIGALWVGTVAEHFSEPIALAANSVIALMFAGFVWKFIPEVRTAH
jgi:MFS family permease